MKRERERPLPCPFCGAEMAFHRHASRAKDGLVFRYWLHPLTDDCIASGWEIAEGEVAGWNRRAAGRKETRRN